MFPCALLVPTIMGRRNAAGRASAALVAMLCLPAQHTQAQDVVAVSPETHQVMLENPEVRVLSVHMQPGEKVAMHSHPRNVVYYLSDATLRITTASGKVEDRVVKAGTAAWSDGSVHAVENIGSTELREVQVEMKSMTTDLTSFATRYAAAWSSQSSAQLAAFYADNGSLIVNGGPPSIGRAAIAAKAQSFMTAFPDMVVKLQRMDRSGGHPVFRWIWTGTNTGPGGTGKSVRMTGYEEWTMDADGLIEKSDGHYDEAEYQRQLKVGAPRQ